MLRSLSRRLLSPKSPSPEERKKLLPEKKKLPSENQVLLQKLKTAIIKMNTEVGALNEFLRYAELVRSREQEKIKDFSEKNLSEKKSEKDLIEGLIAEVTLIEKGYSMNRIVKELNALENTELGNQKFKDEMIKLMKRRGEKVIEEIRSGFLLEIGDPLDLKKAFEECLKKGVFENYPDRDPEALKKNYADNINELLRVYKRKELINLSVVIKSEKKLNSLPSPTSEESQIKAPYIPLPNLSKPSKIEEKSGSRPATSTSSKIGVPYKSLLSKLKVDNIKEEELESQPPSPTSEQIEAPLIPIRPPSLSKLQISKIKEEKSGSQPPSPSKAGDCPDSPSQIKRPASPSQVIDQPPSPSITRGDDSVSPPGPSLTRGRS